MADKKIDIEKLLKGYVDSTQKILELIDESVIKLEDDNGREIQPEQQELNERASDSDLFWRKYYKKRLKLMAYQTIREVAQKAETPIQSAFYRGILLAYQEEADWFKLQQGIAKENRKKDKEGEGGVEPIGDLKI